MEESEHENTLQLTRGFLQHMFGGASQTSEAWRVRKYNLARPRPIIFKCIIRETKTNYLSDRKKLAGTQTKLDEDRTPIQSKICAEKWEK